MRLILNVIWLVFGGLWLALGYLLAALICFVLIITIPFGFAAGQLIKRLFDQIDARHVIMQLGIDGTVG